MLILNLFSFSLGRKDAYGNIDFFLPLGGVLDAAARHTACCRIVAETIPNPQKYPGTQKGNPGIISYLGGIFYEDEHDEGSFDVAI